MSAHIFPCFLGKQWAQRLKCFIRILKTWDSWCFGNRMKRLPTWALMQVQGVPKKPPFGHYNFRHVSCLPRQLSSRSCQYTYLLQLRQLKNCAMEFHFLRQNNWVAWFAISMFIETKVAKLCGESYVMKVSMARFVAKVIVPKKSFRFSNAIF